MPLFLRALPLSFQAFWRYLLLLPFLAIAAFLVSLIGGLFPFLGSIVPGTVSAGLVIIGLRCALRARGHGNELDLSQLLLVSLFFGVVFVAAGWLLSAINWALAWGLGTAGIEIDPVGYLVGLLLGLLGQSFYWSAILLGSLSLIGLVTAALAVPMTEAAASATHLGRRRALFYGAGQGLPSLLLVMVVWLFSGHIYSIFGEVWTVFGLLATALWAWVQGEAVPWSHSLDPWTALRGTLLMAWASSWFFATAVLAWEQRVGRDRAERIARVEEQSVSGTELRDLRARRMRGDRGGPTDDG